MPLATKPLTKSFGVEITGVDLSQELSDADFASIRDAWLKEKVVVMRGQKLEEEDLVRFGRRFGELEIHVRTDVASKRNPAVLMVSNKKQDGKPLGVLGDAEAPWHVDQIYQKNPTFGTILYGVEIPGSGGSTYVCDLAAAYHDLPDALRSRIDGKRAVNCVAHFNTRTNGGMTEEQIRRMPPVTHPMVRTHPVLGRKSLFISGHTKQIEGLSVDESRALLDELEQRATAEGHVYAHRWTVGDVLMWDNTTTMHRRDPFDSNQTRLLKRVSFMYPPEMRTPY